MCLPGVPAEHARHLGRACAGCVPAVCRGMCRMCAGCVPGVCRQSVQGIVPGVCRECAGRVRESMGPGCAGGVPGVCRVVCRVGGVCHARHLVRRLPERAGVPGGARGCAVCRVCVPGVCRECAGCVPGVCRCVGRGCVGCVACA